MTLPIGSPSALSLAQAADPLAPYVAAAEAALAVGVVVTKFLYCEYERYKKEKHDKLIKSVITLFLEQTKVPIRGTAQFVKLATPFERQADGSFHATSLTNEEIKTMASEALKAIVDPCISPYKLKIYEAIRLLAHHYFLPHRDGSVTPEVIQHLMYILNNNCLGYEGLELDIAQLEGLINYSIAYAELAGQGKVKTPEFRRFNQVARLLEDAKEVLVSHRDCRSQSEIANTFRTKTLNSAYQLLKASTKLFCSPGADWESVDAQPLDDLERGVICPYSIEEKDLLLLFLETESDEKIIQHPLFHAWFAPLITFLKESVSPTNAPFKPPAFLADDAVTKLAPKDIANFFEDNEHIFTTEVVKGKADPVTIKDDAKRKARLTVLRDLRNDILSIILLHDQLMGLAKVIQHYGNDEADNPLHFQRLYALMDALCDRIKKQSRSLTKQFEKVITENRGDRSAENVFFIKGILRQFQEVTDTINSESGELKEHRKHPLSETPDMVRHNILDRITQTERLLGIEPPRPHAPLTIPKRKMMPSAPGHEHPQAPTSRPPSPAAENRSLTPTATLPTHISLTNPKPEPLPAPKNYTSYDVYFRFFKRGEEKVKAAPIHKKSLETLSAMRDVFDNYSRGYNKHSLISRITSSICLFFTLKNRHHIDWVTDFIEKIDHAMAELQNPATLEHQTVNELFSEMKGKLKEEGMHLDGSLARRIHFIIGRNEFEHHHGDGVGALTVH
ncbi:MAG: hypothetical protein NTW08_05610 [Gammaproteobacteria bacterium]|nr:hypothetical protein [Gammaproteobacteria bacterium]